MAAEHLQLQADDAAHVDRRASVGTAEQPDLDVPAPRAQAGERGRERGRAAEAVERDVGSPTAGRGAQLDGEGQGRGRRVDRHHLGAARDGHHHGGQAHAAAAVHDDGLAGLHPRDVRHGAVGGREPAAQPGGDVEVDGVRHGDQVDVGARQRHPLRERAPLGEARLQLPLAHLARRRARTRRTLRRPARTAS